MIHNFGQVDHWLFRSGRYRLRDLAHIVEVYGIQRVIDLRDRPPLFKLSSYRRVGVTFIRYPISEYEPLSEDVLRILDPQYVTLIHCWKGAHRTGAVVGLYRRRCQGWPPEEVWREMKAFGFGNPEKHPELFESVFNADFVVSRRA